MNPCEAGYLMGGGSGSPQEPKQPGNIMCSNQQWTPLKGRFSWLSYFSSEEGIMSSTFSRSVHSFSNAPSLDLCV